jgi:anti-anti-sigma regulatory factor/HAMP domain-containing protein
MIRTFSVPLRIRLLIAFLLVTGLSVATVSGISVLRAGESLLADTGRVLRARAESEAGSVGAALDSQLVRLRALALGRTLRALTNLQNQGYTSDPGAILAANDARWAAADETDSLVITVNRSSVANDLQASAALDPDTLGLMLTDRHGGLVAATSRPDTYDQSDEVWWRQAVSQGFHISSPVYVESADAFGLIIAVAVRDPASDDLVGVLRSTYRLDAISELLAAAGFGATGRAELLMGSASLALGEGGEHSVDAAQQALISEARSADYAEGPIRGTWEILALAPVDGSPEVKALGWEVLLLQVEDEALASVGVARSSALITALAVLVVAAVVALVLARRIVRPIEEVTAAAESIAAGDLGRRLALASRDELGRLAGSFNQMAASLEQRIAAEQSAQTERLALQQEMIAAQEQRLEELAAPVIPLNDHTLLLPVIGTVDKRRADQIMQTLLADVAARRARLVLVDLTGVRAVDDQIAQALLHIVHAVRLIGAEVALVGLRPDVAISIVALDVDLAGVHIYSDLQSALAGAAFPARAASAMPPR